MATKNQIVQKGRGHYLEGILTAITPKPGTCLQLTSASGANTYQLWNGAADGENHEVIILLEDMLQGSTVDTAYAASSRCFLYIPQRGDEFLVLFGNASGTADDVAIGDKLMIDKGTGKAIPTSGSPEMEPFLALEAITDPTADQLLLVRMID